MSRLVHLLPLFWLSGCLVPQAMVDHLLDADADGERTAVVGGTDCDDADPKVHAKGEEVCGNLVDDDCDGVTDDDGVGDDPFHPDDDHDGYGDPASTVRACEAREGLVVDGTDCDDGDRLVHPDAVEDCANALDDDCDGTTDEADAATRWWPDFDGDGWGTDRAEPIEACTEVPGRVAVAGDCDDHEGSTYPGAPDRPYDGVDADCDAADDFDVDRDGAPVDPATAVPEVTDVTYVPGSAADCDDHDPQVGPGIEETWYDGVDADCDGADDFDFDADGHAASAFGGDDCDDLSADVHPGHTDVCDDGVDANCDPTDEHDCDGDRHVDAADGGDDCDDADPDVWALCGACGDRDRDGRWAGCDAYTTHVGPDCDDADLQNWDACATCGDGDGDGRYDHCDAYVTYQHDCDDAERRTWSTCDDCADDDGDGRWAGCDLDNDDCDDALRNAWSACDGCVDEDGDGTGVGTCEGPVDCDDGDPDVDVSCGLCVDADGDGSRTGCDRHLWSPPDCDDHDPTKGGHLFEVVGDGVDQDCDGQDLTVSERDGVFVATTGVDDAACGTKALPCRTPGYAAKRAAKAGKVLFVAEGSYDDFETAVSVHGGFDPVTWDQGGPTRVILRPFGSLFVSGAATEIRDVTVERQVGADGYAGFDLDGGFVRLANVVARFPATSTCELVQAEVRDLVIEESSLSGCGGRVQNVGVRLVGDRARRLELSATSLGVLAAPSPAPSVGVSAARGVDVSLVDSTIVVGSGAESTGVQLGGGGDLGLVRSTLDVGGEATTPSGTVTGVWGSAEHVSILGSVIDASGVDSSGVFLELTGEGVLEIAGSIVRSDGISRSSAVTTSDQGSATLVGSTVIARGPSAVSIDAGSSNTVVDTILASDLDVLAVRGTYVLVQDVFEVPCLDGFWWDLCETTVPRTLTSCDADGCSVVGTLVWSTSVLDAASTWGASPSALSAVRDVGVDPAPFTTWRWDVLGQSRVAGPWDVGAIELP